MHLLSATALLLSIASVLGSKTPGQWTVEINGKSFQDTKIEDPSFNLGTTIKYRGVHIQFDFHLSDFSITDTLTGAEAPDRLVSKPTNIIASKVLDVPAATVATPKLDRFEISKETSTLLITVSGGKYKIQAKDTSQGGTLQTEPEFAASPVLNFTQILADGIFYFVNPFTNKINFGDGLDPVTSGADHHELMIAKDSPEAATKLFQDGNTTIWSIQAGGRVGAVFGEDAIEDAPAAGKCTSQCQKQNQVHDSLPIPPVEEDPIP
ncbi:hypothetical protein DL96DRAFT_1558677 [Flagelloscypha sp. PMI_526]|nr:hypothetical protein DL96DRAFT_1558677 [Flagelloscypha sp. PMI_526]